MLIISIGSDSPFEFLDILGDTIQKEAEHILEDIVAVYFDLLSCVGNNENRYIRLLFDKKFPNTFFNKITNLKAADLPFNISEGLRKFYAEHLDEALRCSVLTQKEKNDFLLSSIA
jgi:hypothetical protein